MKYRLVCILMIVVFILAGCNSSENKSKAITLTLKNNEKLEVEFVPTDDLSLKNESDNEFEVYDSKGNKYIHLIFISEDEYKNYSEIISETEGCTIKGIGEEDNVAYMFYEYKTSDSVQYNRIMSIEGKDIFMMMYCYDSEEIANKVFENLTFTVN